MQVPLECLLGPYNDANEEALVFQQLGQQGIIHQGLNKGKE